MTRAVRLAGVAAALGYVAVVLLSRLAMPDGARPLYDGLTPTAPYRWVNPPEALRDLNVAPAPAHGTADRSAGADASLAFETPDQQASVTGDLTAFALTGAETGVQGDLVPLDPTAYGPLPASQGPSGNVYRLTVHANPGGREVTTFARPVSVSLRIANTAATTLYASPDGRRWTRVDATVAAAFVVANVTRPGYYLLGGPASLLPELTPRAKEGGSRLALWVAGAAALLVLAGVTTGLRRRSR